MKKYKSIKIDAISRARPLNRYLLLVSWTTYQQTFSYRKVGRKYKRYQKELSSGKSFVFQWKNLRKDIFDFFSNPFVFYPRLAFNLLAFLFILIGNYEKANHFAFVIGAIAVDTTSSSGPKAAFASFSWSHTVGSSLSNSAVIVPIQLRDGSGTDLPVSTVTVGGNSASKAYEPSQMTDVDTGHTLASIWIRLAPSSGANTIVVTPTGTVDFGGAQAISLSGISQSTTPNQTATGNDPASASSDPSVNITPTVDGCIIIDSIYDQSDTDFTVGANQTQIAQYDPKNGGGDRAFSSYSIQTTATLEAMNWTPTANTDKWISAVAAFAPATASTAVQDIIDSEGIIPFER